MTRTSSEHAARPCGLVVFLSLTSLGCGGPRVEYSEVEGKVTVNSKPAIGVVVRFYPVGDERQQLPYATGLTDATGRYSLIHGDKKSGAVVGKSRAVVYWPSRDMRAVLGNGPEPSPKIPLRYTVASETPLVVEVKAEARQTIDLSLKDKD